MGEHHTVIENNEVTYVCKLGTLSNMYYVRRDEASFLLPFDAKKDTDIAELLEDTDIIWRFPYPKEDVELSSNISYSKLVEAIDEREVRSFKFYADKAEILTSYHDKCRGGIEIIGERYSQEGIGRTIFSCEGCKKLFSLSNAEVEKMKAEIINSFEGSEAFIEQLAARIKPNPRSY